ncbi:response regulator [Actinoplanes sp. DH11]|uniref:hybrid sensor histidine kinase/response regulator n=1 Tax=Actinoplanes sp. DH11 TaxID=2857011 RepID=UPI001E51D37D|nr:response regulator [Actinoplanes sp. DH11]
MATVMVVDDVAANRDIVRMLLGFRGHDVIEARDGADALRLAHVHHPDVVVSDVLMPGIDGLELVHRLRSDPDPQAAQAPVIFYTANYLEPETRPIAEACGVSQVVLRSQDPHTLLEAIDTALAQGPVLLDVPAGDDDFAQAHLHAVNAKLIEKVRALHDTERRFEAMAVASPVGIGILDVHGNADYINERFTEILQLPQENLLGHGWLDILEPAAQDAALDLLHGAGDTAELRLDHRITWPDGTTRRLRLHLRQIHDDEDGRLAGGVLMVDDVTDLVSAEERLREETQRRQEDARHRDAERLDSLRRMAGGTAHDFNNILGAILGYTNLAIETINDGQEDGTLPAETAESLLGDLQHVLKGGERAKGLTQQLLAFGRREIIQPAAINLNTLLRDAAPSLRAATGDDVELVLDLDPALPDVKADPAQITRALHSLVSNGAEAMPDGGTVTVTTAAQDENVTVRITDTGTGMPQAVLDRAFEPFFSTKPAGSTAGLGLSTAHGIISQAGGQLTLRSREGHGTTATVTLPALVTEAPPPPPADRTEEPAGGETLLLVDDEEAVLQVTARILSGAGYQVLTAGDAGEALRILEQHPGHVSALVTDVVMPGMNGRQLAKVASMRQPGLSIVFVSGFAESLIDEKGNNLEPGSTILAKPFDRDALVSTVRGALNAAPHR